MHSGKRKPLYTRKCSDLLTENEVENEVSGSNAAMYSA